MRSRWQAWKIEAKVVTPAAAAAANSRWRSSSLNCGSTERWLAWVLTIGTSSSTTSSPGIARSTCLTATMTLGTAERSCSATRFSTRMDEQRPQIVEPLGEKFGERGDLERHCTVRGR